jgi:formylmethanofuran dehydrogenase subunit E
MHPEIANKNQQRMLAYREMSDDELFDTQLVRVTVGPEEMPGFKGDRIVCDQCGEGINYHREVVRDGRTLCKACAGERYWVSVESGD